METSPIIPTMGNRSIPATMAPKLHGIGDPSLPPILFTDFTFLFTKTSTESGLEEVLPLMSASIKVDGLTLCSIPFYYKSGFFKIHSSSLFSFVNDSSLTKFQEFVKNIIFNQGVEIN